MSITWALVRRIRKTFGEPITADMLTELDAKGWELYHVEKDWAENHNIATENKPRLIEMIATWYAEVGKIMYSNELCPCGSGKKLKRCHGQQKSIQTDGKKIMRKTKIWI